MAQAIVGLGNPGPEYRDTRHNMGARVLDALAKKLKVRFRRTGGHLVGQTRWRGQILYLIKPQCFMNVMGAPVARATRKLQLAPGELIFVYDDLDLPLGKVRVRLKGSAGGHNGVRSLIHTLGTDQLRRVKVGIGRPCRPSGIVKKSSITCCRPSCLRSSRPSRRRAPRRQPRRSSRSKSTARAASSRSVACPFPFSLRSWAPSGS